MHMVWTYRPVVVLALCCAMVVNGRAAFMRSSDLATHCALKGELGNKTVTMHVFLRLAPGFTGNSLRAAGFAMLQAQGPERYFLHMTHGDVLEHLNWSSLFLRSPYSGQRYDLVMQPAPTLQKVLAGDIQKRPGIYQEVISVWGNWTLHTVDQPHKDFELRMEGFNWFCTVLAEASPLLKGAATLARPWPTPHEPAIGESSLGPATKVWILLSTFHEAKIAAFSSLLQHHWSWHKQMGVHGYILYAQGWLGSLLEDPVVKAFITDGRLYPVLFDDLGRHEHTPLHPEWIDRYMLQVLIESHLALSLWNSDSLVVYIDIDEFLMTPQPMSVTQVFKATATGKAAIEMRRHAMQCTKNASSDCCVRTEACLPRWQALSAAVKSGKARHPLTCMEAFTLEPSHLPAYTKLIVDPNLVSGINTHWISRSVPGTTSVAADQNIVQVAHVVNMYGARHPKEGQAITMKEAAKNWFWPADQLQSQNLTATPA